MYIIKWSPFIAIITERNSSQRQLDRLDRKNVIWSLSSERFLRLLWFIPYLVNLENAYPKQHNQLFAHFFKNISVKISSEHNLILLCPLTINKAFFCSLNCAYQLNHKWEAQQMLQNNAIRYRNFVIASIQPALYENCRLQKIKILPWLDSFFNKKGERGQGALGGSEEQISCLQKP